MFLVVVLVFGGGGSPNPWSEVVIQLSAATLAIAWFCCPRGGPSNPATETGWIAAIFLLVPIAQLLPLPPAIWHALPGRELQIDALSLIGERDNWHPLSVAPHATFSAFLALVVPAGFMLAAGRLDIGAVKTCLAVIVLTGGVGALLGLLQIVSEPGAFRLYSESHRDWAVGFFANRNATADAFLIAFLAAAAWVAASRLEPAKRRILSVTTALLFFIVTLLTGSRAGIVVGFATAVYCVWFFRRANNPPGLSKRMIAVTIAGLAGMIVASLWRGGIIAQRFTAPELGRFDLWQDGWAAISSYWPAGSGMGTFRQAFLPFERLEAVDFSMPNRMHNDYLELVLEAGGLGITALLLIAVLVIRLALQAVSAPKPSRPFATFAIGTILLIALHSTVDYPLRNMALSCLLAFAVGILGNRNLFPAPRPASRRQRHGMVDG